MVPGRAKWCDCLKVVVVVNCERGILPFRIFESFIRILPLYLRRVSSKRALVQKLSRWDERKSPRYSCDLDGITKMSYLPSNRWQVGYRVRSYPDTAKLDGRWRSANAFVDSIARPECIAIFHIYSAVYPSWISKVILRDLCLPFDCLASIIAIKADLPCRQVRGRRDHHHLDGCVSVVNMDEPRLPIIGTPRSIQIQSLYFSDGARRRRRLRLTGN